MQASLHKSDFWLKAIGVASFANLSVSAIALADMLKPNQKPFIIPQFQPLTTLKKMPRFRVERNYFAQNICSIERDSVCEF